MFFTVELIFTHQSRTVPSPLPPLPSLTCCTRKGCVGWSLYRKGLPEGLSNGTQRVGVTSTWGLRETWAGRGI